MLVASLQTQRKQTLSPGCCWDVLHGHNHRPLIIGLFRRAVFCHGGAPENCPPALVGRFPSLMGRFLTLMGRFPECLNGPLSLLKISGPRKWGVEFKGGGLHDGFGGFDGSGAHLALFLLLLQNAGRRGNRDGFGGYGGFGRDGYPP